MKRWSEERPWWMTKQLLWQFKSGATGAVWLLDLPEPHFSAWDRSLGRRVYYQP